MNSSTVTGNVAEYSRIWRLRGRNAIISSSMFLKSCDNSLSAYMHTASVPLQTTTVQ